MLLFYLSIIQVCFGSSSIAEYFVPADADLFQIWRDEKLCSVPSLFEFTDTSGRFTREEIETVLLPVFLPRSVPLTLNNTVQDEDMKQAVRRAIYAMVILSDLDLVCSASLTNPWEFIGDLHRHTQGQVNDRMLALTFVMILPSCDTVWESIKAIANQHRVDVVHLAHHVANIGATEGTKWFLQTLRPKRVHYIATF